jgi:small subunit ribosomal protein S8e
LHKKKSSGGRKRAYRKKRRFERGSFAVETIPGNSKRKEGRKKGGNRRIRILREKFACVTDPKSGKTEKVEIQRVIRNPANVDYDRRGVITKGTIIKTALGSARVTSRPGQDGTINAVLTEEK